MNESQRERDDNTPGSNHQQDAMPVPPTVHDADVTDQPPPVSVPGKGPMDQSVPDVAVGSTPATRRDD